MRLGVIADVIAVSAIERGKLREDLASFRARSLQELVVDRPAAYEHGIHAAVVELDPLAPERLRVRINSADHDLVLLRRRSFLRLRYSDENDRNDECERHADFHMAM